MTPREAFAIQLGKVVSGLSKVFHFGAGGTWPGEIALILQPDIARNLARQLKKGVILIAGTNGKTTTALMIKTILEKQGDRVVHNASGANLTNGIVSALIKEAKWNATVDRDWGVFEVDENSLPIVLEFISPKAIVLLNLFRDQLDRYGEVDVIVEKWASALKNIHATYILNSDDPGIAFIGTKAKGKILYFGVNDKKHFLKNIEHATDSTFCLNCGGRLSYKGIYYSHIGIWHCERCGLSRPKPDIFSVTSPLSGLYNLYNTLAAVTAGRALGIKNPVLAGFSPAFGRQETFTIKGKTVKIFLSKNPAGFNASLRTILEQNASVMLFILNDRIPDGRDVSWIWDVDFETIPQNTKIIASGDRVYDLAIRLKYAEKKNLVVEPDLREAVQKAVEQTPPSGRLFILPTYSAMLEVRKILLGRKIL